MAKRYSLEFKSRALDLLAERREVEGENETLWASYQLVASQVGGISPSILQKWHIRQRKEDNAGGWSVWESEQYRRLERERRRLLRELEEARKEQEIMKAASAFFRPDPDDPEDP